MRCTKRRSQKLTVVATSHHHVIFRQSDREWQKQLAAVKLLIIDELGLVPLSKTRAELLF